MSIPAVRAAMAYLDEAQPEGTVWSDDAASRWLGSGKREAVALIAALHAYTYHDRPIREPRSAEHDYVVKAAEIDQGIG